MKNNKLKYLVITLALTAVQFGFSQNTKRDYFHNIPEIKAFDMGMKLAKPMMQTSLEESMYTEDNIATFGGKKGVKKIIGLFMGRFDPNYISNMYYDEIESKYSNDEMNCLAELNCKDVATEERWKEDYLVFQTGTDAYAAKYGESLMLEIISEVTK